MAVIPEAVLAAAAAAESLIHPVVFIVVPVIFLVFTMISVSLRIYVRTILTKAYGYDDWALIFALLIYTGYVALFILIGVSEHIYGLLTILDVLVKYALAGQMLYLVAGIALKIAQAAFLLRIAMERWQNITIYTATAIFIVYELAYIFLAIFACGLPTTQNLLLMKCISWSIFGPFTYLSGSLHAITNLVFLGIPCTLVANRTMPRATRIPILALIALFAVGSIVSIVRIPFLADIERTGDLTYFSDLVPVSLLSLADEAIGIITISLVTLRPLVSRWIGPLHRQVEPDFPNYEDLAGRGVHQKRYQKRGGTVTQVDTIEGEGSGGLSQHSVEEKSNEDHGSMLGKHSLV